MDVLSWMQPRNTRDASRVVATLIGVAVTTTVFSAPLQAQQHGAAELALGCCLLLIVLLMSLAAQRMREPHRVAWAVAPVVGIVILTAMDILTRDASVTAQIFFVFPVLYGSSQLRAKGAGVVTALAIIGEVVVVSTLLPAGEALVNAWYVAAAMATTGALLSIISERHARLVVRLKRMAALDPLTGLATRRVLDDAAASALSGSGAGAGTALILLDVDHFKSINDQYGHPAGDQVLVQLGALLLAHSRERDVVCRLGGDEVAVLLPDCPYPAAVARAEELLAATYAHTFHVEDGDPLPVSVSIGCAHLPTHASDMRSLYSAADAALYDAKQRGRGRVTAVG